MTGFILLNKKEGVTSFKAVSTVRHITGEKKAGHSGTLDPMATGLLPIALGGATRFLSFLPSGEKAYTARFRLGLTTDTLDITGKITSETEVVSREEDVLAVLPFFKGKIKQTPPIYSAISKDGVRLYKLARQGLEIEREEREINVYSLELAAAYGHNEYEIKVECGTGTYIRSLISDIGASLGCGAVMTALKRTKSNGFSIDNSYTEDELRALAAKSGLNEAVIPLESVFSDFAEVYITDAQKTRFQNGGELDVSRLTGVKGDGLYRVFSKNGDFLGLGEKRPDVGSLFVKRSLNNSD
ncbi:MAG: tRNA pseudouridine(55) synthase TruB [Oscillospiraceae bacterium]|nr:tRNA pseudouridine(55) synthase TruB [Oscillospiraceae bacterium]